MEVKVKWFDSPIQLAPYFSQFDIVLSNRASAPGPGFSQNSFLYSFPLSIINKIAKNGES